MTTNSTLGTHPAATVSPAETRTTARDLLLKVPWALVATYVVMVAVFTILAPSFFSLTAFANILQDWAPIVLLAAAQTLIMITAGIDLSLGANLILSGVTSALVMRQLYAGGTPEGTTLAVGVVVALLVGALVGATNGILIVWLKLAPFIATLATMGATTGIALVISGGQQVTGGPPIAFLMGNTFYGGLVTIPVIVAFVTVVILGLYLHYSRFGRINYAIGSNAFAVRAAGVSISKHLMLLYTLAGIVAAIGGLVAYTRLGGASPAPNTTLLLNAVAAAVVGGVSLFGGVGRMVGTALGALIITSVLSGLIILNVNPNWQQVVIGVIIAAAVSLQTRNGRRKSRSPKSSRNEGAVK